MEIKDIICRILVRLGVTKNHWPICLLEYANMQLYKQKQGYSFDLDSPRTFTEKIQWQKTRFKRQDIVRYVDKFLFKQLIKEKLGDGFTIPMYGAWTNVNDFRNAWDSLPEKFCLKSTLQSDGKYIKVIEKSQTDLEELCNEVKEWLRPKNLLIHSFCSAYYKAVPRILAEEYMESVKDQLYDYKFFCFDGKPHCIYAATEHFQDEFYPISFYDLEWGQMNVQYGNHRKDFIPKPLHFDEMKEIAFKLCQGFPFIRVDFFDTPNKLYVAELTFYPGGGLTPYHPEEFNEKLGNMLHLKNK